jgi:hypothetical protein
MDFEKHARLLNDLQYSAEARCRYELMSGAVMWDDERIHLPLRELGCGLHQGARESFQTQHRANGRMGYRALETTFRSKEQPFAVIACPSP